MTVYHWGKAVLTGLLVLALSGSLTGCSVGAKQQSVYDDDAQIVQEGDSYSFAKRTGTLEDDELTLEYRRFYGVQTVWSIDAASEQKLRLEFDSLVQKGKFKIVLVSPDDELLVVLEQGGQGVAELDLPPGEHALKIVGQNAAGRIEVQMELRDADPSSAATL